MEEMASLLLLLLLVLLGPSRDMARLPLPSNQQLGLPISICILEIIFKINPISIPRYPHVII